VTPQFLKVTPQLLKVTPQIPGVTPWALPGPRSSSSRAGNARTRWGSLEGNCPDSAAEGPGQDGIEDECPAELLAEILGKLTVKEISIERISVDCPGPNEAPLSEADLGHVTEIYDFPPTLKTEDLMEMFLDFHESGFKLQWVDGTHALGIFSSLSTGILGWIWGPFGGFGVTQPLPS
uniref:R3H domain and coiled-coil containing 1 n=1 Tax=Malurus cyaneus samueli TaxID=2593467 RepID=A0A8C5TDI0_9PASS